MFTEAEKLEFRSAVKSVTDMFFGLTAQYGKSGSSLDRWGETSEPRITQWYALAVLKVWKDDTAGQVEIGSEGMADFAEGYLLFNYEDCEAVGLTQNGEFIGEVGLDKVKIAEVEYEIIGIQTLGQFVDKPALVKIQIRRKL